MTYNVSSGTLNTTIPFVPFSRHLTLNIVKLPTLRIRARSVYRWNLRTLDYFFAADSMGLASFTSTWRASEEAIKLDVALRSFNVTQSHRNRYQSKSNVCDFLLVVHCNYMPVFCRFHNITIYCRKSAFSPFLPITHPVSFEALARAVPLGSRI